MRALLLALLLVLPGALAFDGRDAAVGYLAASRGADGGWETRPSTDWVMLGLAAAGEDVPAWDLDAYLLTHPPDPTSLLAWERSTLALGCAGYDAQAYARIVEAQFVNGQFGNPSWLHDDAWGILSLRAAGTPATDARLQQSAAMLVANQHASGGWGWAKGGPPDVDDTGAVLMALAAARPPGAEQAEARALAYLDAARNADGGWANLPGGPSNLPSTAWAAMGLLAWGEDATAAQAYLATLQQSDGSFEYAFGQHAASRAAFTGTALVALEGKSYVCAT